MKPREGTVRVAVRPIPSTREAFVFTIVLRGAGGPLLLRGSLSANDLREFGGEFPNRNNLLEALRALQLLLHLDCRVGAGLHALKVGETFERGSMHVSLLPQPEIDSPLRPRINVR